MQLDRRALLGGAALAASAAGAALAQTPSPATPPTEPEVIDLWNGAMPAAGKGRGGPEVVLRDGSHDGSVTNVSQPRLRVFRAAKPNGTAVIVVAGGGYRRINIRATSEAMARWLNIMGVTAFVLYYRMPVDGWAPQAPLQDMQRAVRVVRARAAEFGVDPAKIGAVGASAGGHLVGMISSRADEAFYGPIDDADKQSARPDFAGLIYPVITLKPPFDNTQTRRMMAGENPTAEQSAAMSVETHVSNRTPPTFLAQCVDDSISAVDNSLIMFGALRAAKAPVELHVFEQGGHSFNMGVPGGPTSGWPTLFANWAKSHGFFGGKAIASRAVTTD
jgi:acetyl esterase/lipase